MTVWTASKPHLALFNEIAAAYTAKHPDVKSVTFETLPFDNYTSTLTTQIAGGNAPDMAWIFENDAPDFVSSKALVNLTPTLQKTDGYQYNDLATSPLKLWKEGDALYAYPFSTSPFGMFYNVDLFSAAGQKTPAQMVADGTWTWENAAKAGAAINAASGKAGVVVGDFNYKNWVNLSSVWRGFGADPWSKDGTKCTFNSPEMVDAMTFVHDAAFKQKSMPAPGSTADFFAGDAAMTVTQISRASLLEDGAFKWDLVPLPTGPKVKAQVIGQAGIGVFASSPNADKAADFLAFLTNPENSAKLAQFFPPPRKSLLTSTVLAKSSPLLTSVQLENVVIKGIQVGVVNPNHSGFGEIQQTVRGGLDPLWQPGADVKKVLDKVCSSLQPLLTK